MRCALFPSNNAVAEDFFRIRAWRTPGSTVVPSHCSPADLAGKHKLLSSSWAAATSANTGGRHGSFFASTPTPYAPSYSFARATPATLRCVRDVSWANHLLRPEDCLVRCCMTARAPVKRRAATGAPHRLLGVHRFQQLPLVTAPLFEGRQRRFNTSCPECSPAWSTSVGSERIRTHWRICLCSLSSVLMPRITPHNRAGWNT